jgi:hypothetical protein
MRDDLLLSEAQERCRCRRPLGLPLLVSMALVMLLCTQSACLRRSGAGRDYIATPVADLAPVDPAPEDVLARYLQIQRTQPRLSDYQVDVEIEASLPKLNREGGMQATRVQRGESQLSYAGAQFTGDDTIKRDVITRYLNGERDTLRNPPNAAISDANYRFAYRGVAAHNDRRVHVFEVIPKEERVGLFRGELWIDMETGQPLREFGRFVKSPSVFVKDVDFVRDYRLHEGRLHEVRALPSRFISYLDTRLVGPASMTVHFRNYRFEDESADPSAGDDNS